MNADKMFEELGYKKTENENWIIYTNEAKEKDIDFYLYGKTIEVNNGHGSKPFTMDELKAINKKVEELGWIK